MLDVQCSRRKPLLVNFSPRRSTRLVASVHKGVSEEKRSQLTLVWKLGLASEDEGDTLPAIASCEKLFDHPLSWSHLVALAELFRMTVPGNLSLDPEVLVSASSMPPSV